MMNSILLRISLGNLWKNRFTTGVSIFGLSVGFTAFILISLFMRYEFRWDRENENFDRIYLVERDVSLSSEISVSGHIVPFTPGASSRLIGERAGFEKASSILQLQDRYLSVSAERQYRIETGIYADGSYFDIFSYRFIHGNPAGFDSPFITVISRSLARRLFGSDDAVGKIVSLDRKNDLKVTGVYDDLPLNSSIRPEYIVSLPTVERIEGINPGAMEPVSWMTFVLLKPGYDAFDAGAGIRELFSEYESLQLGTLRLNTLERMRFDSVPDYYTFIWVFGLIGIFILSMSVFNYVNLSIANSTLRGKEIAVKKMNGSSRKRLVLQFLGETVLLSAVALGISLYIVSLTLPWFNSIMDTAITLDGGRDGSFIALMGGASLAIGALAGLYPALYLSSNSIISLFKGNFRSGSEKIRLRKALVLLQFAISVFLICLSLFFLRQINHLAGKDIGFERRNMLYVRMTTSENADFEDFRDRLLQNPEIVNASMSVNLPFVNFGGGTVNWEGAAPGERTSYRPNTVSWDFAGNLEMEIVDGRDFSRNYPADTGIACLVNETAVRYFGWDNPVGMRLDDNRYRVVGVVRDYHVMDIHNPIDPVVLVLGNGDMAGEKTYAFRYLEGRRDRAMSLIAQEFSTRFPNDPFEIEDLESAFVNENAYRVYQTIKRSVLLFTLFNILLAVTGLFGLVAFIIVRRTKEIGIRKINGSTVVNIFLLLNKEFIILLGISLALAWPGMYLVYDAFPGAYKQPLHAGILFASAILIGVITIVSTGWQTFRAARRNPVEALRYE